eukprot:COSAG04_NODE_21_length_38435_cov_79.510382_15_plen_113_part_00
MHHVCFVFGCHGSTSPRVATLRPATAHRAVGGVASSTSGSGSGSSACASWTATRGVPCAPGSTPPTPVAPCRPFTASNGWELAAGAAAHGAGGACWSDAGHDEAKDQGGLLS